MTVAGELNVLVETCAMYASAVEKEIAEPGKDLRTMCFWNIHNRVKLTEEIMVMYERMWNSGSFPKVDGAVSAELTERIVMVTKDMFIDVVSSVEKAMKDSLKFHTASGLREAALRRSSHLYMRNILLSATESGLIDQREFDQWDLIMIIRNLAAHNNSIADRQGKFTVGGIEISMRPGRMMKGPINTYLILTEQLVGLFYEWLSMLKSRFSS